MLKVIIRMLVFVNMLMAVSVFVDKVGIEQKFRIRKEILRLAVCDDSVLRSQHDDAAGQFFHEV